MKAHFEKSRIMVLGLPFIGADLMLRVYSNTSFMLNQRIPIFGRWVFLTRTHNTGIALQKYSWDMTRNGPDPWMVQVLPSLIWLSLFFIAILRFRDATRLEKNCFTVLLAGATSNLAESLWLGHVTDTLFLVLPNIFPFGLNTNLADFGIIIGSIGCMCIWLQKLVQLRSRDLCSPLASRF
jgi:lipoprotein signal peptidase